MALVTVQKNGTTMTVDSANLALWTGSGWSQVGGGTAAPSPAAPVPQPAATQPPPTTKTLQAAPAGKVAIPLGSFGWKRIDYGPDAGTFADSSGANMGLVNQVYSNVSYSPDGQMFGTLNPGYNPDGSKLQQTQYSTGAVVNSSTGASMGNSSTMTLLRSPSGQQVYVSPSSSDYQAYISGGFTPVSSTTTAPLSPASSSTAASAGSFASSAASIPFKAGLSDAQQQGIASLAQKPAAQWTATDKANWAYATNNAPIPTQPIGTSTGTPQPGSTGSYSSPTAPQMGAGTAVPGSAFTGQHLVKFSSMPNGAPAGENTTTVFLVDEATKSLRPFMSMDALNNYYQGQGIDPQTALSSILTVDPTELETGGLAGFHVLDQNYGVQSDGKVSNANFNPSAVNSAYGQSADVNSPQFVTATNYVKAIKLQMNGLVADGTLKGVTQANLDAIFSDHAQVARLISAMAYGGYDAADITMEAARLAAVKGGNTSLENMSVISDTQTKTAYSQTQNYKLATNNPSIALPKSAADKIMSQTTSPDYFSNPQGSLIDMMKDPNFKTQLDQLKSTYSDIVNQQLSANTERDRQMAQYNWDNFRKVVGTRLGITLAASATDAWDQISNLDKQAAGQGLMGSGIHNEMVDNYLKKVRMNDQTQRTTNMTQEEAQKASFYTSSASPAQVQQLIAEDQASGLPKEQWQSVKWGLIPSDAMKSQFDTTTLYNKLKQDYADKNFPDWYLQQKAQQLHDAALDENGNLRSSIYSNYITSKQANDESSLQNKVSNVYQQNVNQNDQFFSNFQNPAPGDPNYFSGASSFPGFNTGGGVLPSTTTGTNTVGTALNSPAGIGTNVPAPTQTTAPTTSSTGAFNSSLPTGWTMDSTGHPVPPSSTASTTPQDYSSVGQATTTPPKAPDLSAAAQAAGNISQSLSGATKPASTSSPTPSTTPTGQAYGGTLKLTSGQNIGWGDPNYDVFFKQLGGKVPGSTIG